MKIPGVFVEIKGDATQLRKDMASARQIVTESAKGMSNALNNALDSGQIKKGTNTLIANLGTLSRSSANTGKVFNQLGVDLGHLQKVTGVTGNQFAQLQSKMLQTSAARGQEKALRDIAKSAGLSNKEIKLMGQQFGLSRSQIVAVTNDINKSGRSFSAFGGIVKAALASFSVVSLVAVGREVLQIADQYTLLESRLRLVTTGEENLREVQEKLYDISLRTHQSNAETINLYTRMARATESLGLAQSDTLQITETINQALIVSGASATESSAALIQLSQGLASGVLRGEEFNSVMEQTPRLAQALADGLGVDIGKLREMAKEGKLTADVVTKALLSQKDAIEGEFRQMTTTVSQAMTDLGTVVKDIIADANSASGATSGIVTEIQNLASTIDENREGILSLLTEIIRLTGAAIEILGNFGQSFQGLRAVMDGEISFMEYATSNAEELNQKLDENASGLGEINRQLEELKDKRKAIAEVGYYAEEDRKAQRDQIVAINEEVKVLEERKRVIEASGKQYVDTWQKTTRETEKSTTATKKATVAVVAHNEGVKKATKAVVDHGKAAWEAFTGENEAIKRVDRTLKDFYADLDKTNEELYDLKNAAIDADLVDAFGDIDREVVNLQDDVRETSSVITDEFAKAFGSVQSYMVDLVLGAEFNFDEILDIFKRMLAEMLVAILASGIKEAFFAMINGGDMWGAFVNGMSGAAGFGGGMGGGYGGGFTGPGAAGWTNPDGSAWSTIGGGLAVAGGAYGMYAGAQNIKKGNVGTGALQLGLGGLSAYQGAVMLGIVEKGAFTAGMNALGAQIGLSAAPSVAATVGASVGAPSASLAAAESAYLAGSAPAATGVTATTTGASMSGAAATMAAAAPYAVAGLAVFLAGKGIIDKANRPSASAEIDEYGVTPDNLSMFNDQLTATNGTILATVPTLQKYNQAIYDTETQVLTLTNGTKQLQLQYDAADQAGHQWSSTITGGTSIMSSAAAQIIDAFAPLPLSVDQVHEASQLAGQAFEHMASGSELAGRSMNKLEGYLQDLGMSEDQAAAAAQQLIANVEDLGGAAAASASVIAGSANEINRAFRSMESLSSENFDSSAYSSHLVGGTPGDSSFHADGGVFNYGVFKRATRYGRDVFGEAGAEAAVPLHAGPDTLKYMDSKLDSILSSGNTIIFQITGQEVKRVFIPFVDEHVVAKAQRGQLAVRTAYAPS